VDILRALHEPEWLGRRLCLSEEGTEDDYVDQDNCMRSWPVRPFETADAASTVCEPRAPRLGALRSLQYPKYGAAVVVPGRARPHVEGMPVRYETLLGGNPTGR